MRIPNMLEIMQALAAGRAQGHTAHTAFAAADDRAAVDAYLLAHPDKAEAMRAEAEAYAARPIASLRFETYRQFDTTGARNDYQDEYFEHRRRLHTVCMCAYLFGDAYLQEAENIIWAICDEYTWCLPAHLHGQSLALLPNDRRAEAADGTIHPFAYPHPHDLDLFACETARELAELMRLLGDRLHPLVRHRAVTAIIDRVFSQYLTFNSIHHFEVDLSNWSAVCGGSLGVAAIYLMEADAQLAPVVQRVLSDLDVFLASYGQDGIGREGIGYWNYGFVNFCQFADLLKERTGGLLNLFEDEKVKSLAFFPARAFVYKDYCVNFSDCHSQASCAPELLSLLRAQYPDMPLPTALSVPSRPHPRAGHITLRGIFWGGVAPQPPFRARSDFFPDAGWLVSCTEHAQRCFSFIAKGGTNHEPHNHNDLGHFMVFVDEESLLCDLGGGEYTKEYFGKGRYGYLVNASFGHSVPIVAGEGQRAGADARAEITHVQTGQDTDAMTLELASAYPVPSLRSLSRRVQVRRADCAVTIADTYAFTGASLRVTERFVTLTPPRVQGDTVVIQGKRHAVALRCTGGEALPRVTEESYARSDLAQGRAYLIDFDFDLRAQATLTFTVEGVG